MTHPTAFQARTPGLVEPVTEKPPEHAPNDAPRLDHHEKMRLRAAAFRACRVYPGPVGQLVSRELLTWEEFGYRLGGHRLVMAVVTHIESAPIPVAERAS